MLALSEAAIYSAQSDELSALMVTHLHTANSTWFLSPHFTVIPKGWASVLEQFPLLKLTFQLAFGNEVLSVVFAFLLNCVSWKQLINFHKIIMVLGKWIFVFLKSSVPLKAPVAILFILCLYVSGSYGLGTQIKIYLTFYEWVGGKGKIIWK